MNMIRTYIEYTPEDFDKVVFLDIETPNPYQRSICKISTITADRDGNSIDEFSSVIDPEDDLWTNFSRIHDVYPEDIEDAPTFGQIWHEHLKDIFSGARLVVRNVNFSMRVLAKSFEVYGISVGPMRVAQAVDADYEKKLWLDAWEQNQDDADLYFGWDDPKDVADVECFRRSYVSEWKLGYHDPRVDSTWDWKMYDFSKCSQMYWSEIRGCWR